MKKRRDKEYFTLSPDIREEFLKHIEEKNLNKSKLIETLIDEYMKKTKSLENDIHRSSN
jgi:hypothetical protein